MTHDPADRATTQLESCVDYTDLRKTISYGDVESMCADAVAFGFGSVVVPTALVRRAASIVGKQDLAVGSVLSYPFGTQATVVKTCEAEVAVDHGAARLDLIPHFGAILAERWDYVRDELQAVRSAAGDCPLTLVLETGRLRTSLIHELCTLAADCGYAYIANTVGFRLVSTDPDAEGRASTDTIRTLSELSGGSVKIKAAGGLTDRSQAEELRAAGAHRFAVDASCGAVLHGNWRPLPKGDA